MISTVDALVAPSPWFTPRANPRFSRFWTTRACGANAVTVSALPPAELTSWEGGESTAAIRARVEPARARQQARAAATNAPTNARLAPRALRSVCALDSRSERLLLDASERLALTARAFDRVLRVARTIADLEASEVLREEVRQRPDLVSLSEPGEMRFDGSGNLLPAFPA